jgi:flagellar biosynthesis protein FlhF
MKIRTYIAKDMRQALRQVREEQGPDAVILSTRSVPGGVEVSAAIDFELAQATVQAVAPPPRAPAEPAMHAAPFVGLVDDDGDFATLLSRTALTAARTTVTPLVAAPVSAPAAPAAREDATDFESTPRAELGAELRSMRHMLETQLAQLAWNDLTRRAPAQAELLKELTELGLSQPLASELVAGLPAQLPLEDARRRVLALLSHRLPVTGDAMLDHGGRLVFVGPTGVGKTTAIAKLAARWVMRHGSRDIALISLDGQRFGAQEQLKVLGRLLGVEAFALDDVADLPALLARLPERRMILIDTAGMSPRDPELAARAAQFESVAAATGIRSCLVLSAAAQAGVLDEAVQRFEGFRPTCCLLTKLDEAATLGGTISMLARTQLTVSYVSDGQRIPEDLAPARAHQLVARAVRLAREAGAAAGEDLLTRRFGGTAHAIA